MKQSKIGKQIAEKYDAPMAVSLTMMLFGGIFLLLNVKLGLVLALAGAIMGTYNLKEAYLMRKQHNHRRNMQ
jgi:hypothetical protein